MEFALEQPGLALAGFGRDATRRREPKRSGERSFALPSRSSAGKFERFREKRESALRGSFEPVLVMQTAEHRTPGDSPPGR
jgi:hypothetical protein